MTNKENVVDEETNSTAATSLAVHLVSQVLDEACIIVNAAKEFGQPWRSVSKLNVDSTVKRENDNSTFSIERGDNDDVNIIHGSNTIATSTPQKLTEEIRRNVKTDTYIIGQGDEEICTEQDVQDQSDFNKSTSTFINRLFDMSDVEYVADDEDRTNGSNEILMEEIMNIVTLCVDSALSVVIDKENKTNDDVQNTIETSHSSEHSSYSFLDDALSHNVAKNIAFLIDDAPTNSKDQISDSTFAFGEEAINVNFKEHTQTNEIEYYEHAYVTLNRDYEQYSDEEVFIHQDSKSLTLQDVELSQGKTSSLKLPATDKVDYKDLATTSAVSASAVSRKSSLVRRCRLQGARLLACLRGWWWRRKLPGRHKVPRMPGAVRGHCPLSPSARLRAASLLDHRLIRSPSPSRPIIWKFNTINETIVNSAQWNEYTNQIKREDENY
ncbi:PREDICTED: uncharacterized protein LOC106122506 [Papilio xuthus]|uniref:Uncharacterized protein LOC106122506 n=1 Tax=Papilio xuthus TaxID=66420 RepID=A0AAJ6ZJQ5_PAPXU|nr:PREDICTED: uncharacterized protein LOC106122506 [Papilio xuthus]